MGKLDDFGDTLTAGSKNEASGDKTSLPNVNAGIELNIGSGAWTHTPILSLSTSVCARVFGEGESEYQKSKTGS